MTPRPRRPWSTVIEEAGIRVRLYERTPGSLLYREVRTGPRQADRKTLGHRDRALAEQQARQLARRLAELRLVGLGPTVTLGQLFAIYFAERAPALSGRRQGLAASMFAPYFRAHFGDDFVLDNLSQAHVDAYAAARKRGTVRSKKARGVSTPPRDGTIRNELKWFKSVVRFGLGYRVQGRRLLTVDPLEGIRFAAEKNVRRPIASEARYRATLAKAGEADRLGRLACMLALARYTGRRVNAICQLRADDVFLTPDAVARALAAAGEDERRAEHMPHGAIRWRAEHDKKGFDELTPIGGDARAALDRYLREHPRVGGVPLFPDSARPGQPTSRNTADHLLRNAEALAKLPKLERGLWHAYRRLWASERKHQPDVDTARAGGWRDLATMKASYQQPDPATTLKVIENAPPAHTRRTPRKRSGGNSTA